MKAGRAMVILLHALVGWAYCGALIGVGRKFMSMDATLVVHAIGAPIGFVIISVVYFRWFAFTRSLVTAVCFLGVVVAMDVLVVALLIEKSFAMFTSALGTWLPFVLIFTTVWATGELMSRAGLVRQLHIRS